MVSKRERLHAAIAGELADRPPVALWRHFPVDDQDPLQLAQSTAQFQQIYDFDFVKVTPASSFCLKDWGSLDRWEGSTEGVRRYTHRVIHQAEDWLTLKELSPDQGYLADQIRCLRELRQLLGAETPIIQTIFSPLAQAKNLAGKTRLNRHLHRSPDRLRQGLQTITSSTIRFVQAAIEAGIDGIFYAIQHASFDYMDEATYNDLARPDDLAILESASELWLNVLHLHGGGLMFNLAAEYPAHVVNWHALTEGPSLADASERVSGALCAGLRRHETLVLGDPSTVAEEAKRALSTHSGRGLVLGAGCVTPVIAPASNLRAARQSVEDFV